MIVASKRSFIGLSAASIAAAIIDDKSAGTAAGEMDAGTETGCVGICDTVTGVRGRAVVAIVTDANDAETAPSGDGFFGTLLFGEPATMPAQDF